MLYKILLVIWFILRPRYYQHFFYLIISKFLTNHDTLKDKKKGYEWAVANAISYMDAMQKLGLDGDFTGLDQKTILEANKLESKSLVKMGGGSHIHLLFDCVRSIKAKKVIETGVAYGWSSLAILKGLNKNDGKLYSVDMPYPRKKNEKYVGIVVPEHLRKNWILIRKPDRPGIIEALNKAGQQVDLCHYDSDKSWWGRHYGYQILWKSLKSRGLFISDDIQDNLYFSKFVEKKSSKFAVVEYSGKFIGLVRKS